MGVGLKKNWAAHPYQNYPQVFFKDQVYDWGRFQKTGLHIRTKITLKLPPFGSYELIRSYNCKGDILQLEEDILR